MIIRGKVIHSETHSVIEKAHISLRIDDIPFWEGKTIEQGVFEKTSSGNYLGAKLNCRIEKDGFVPWEQSLEIEDEELNIEAVLKPDKIDLPITILGQDGRALKGAKIYLKSNHQPIWDGVADIDGTHLVTLAGMFRNTDLEYLAKKRGFSQKKGKLTLKHDSRLEIRLEKKKKKGCLWPVIIMVIAAALFGLGYQFDSRREEPLRLLFISLSALTLFFGIFIPGLIRFFRRKKANKR